MVRWAAGCLAVSTLMVACALPSPFQPGDGGGDPPVPDVVVSSDRGDAGGGEDLADDLAADGASDASPSDLAVDTVADTGADPVVDPVPDGVGPDAQDMPAPVDRRPGDGGGECQRSITLGENSGDDPTEVLDTFLDEDNQGTSNEGKTIIDIDGGNGKRVHGLIRFDLTGLPSCTILAAELIVFRSGNDDSDTSDLLAFHVVREPWDRSATWLQRVTGTNWSVAGCAAFPCIDAEPVAVQDGIPENNLPNAVPLPVSTIEAWIQDPASNNGLLIRNAEGDDGTELASSEGPNGRRPRLRLMLGPPGPSSGRDGG